MSPSEIVNQVRATLPRYTDLFTDNIANTSISVASGLATATTPSNHGLKDGDAVLIANAVTPNSIVSVSVEGLLFTFETAVNHDLTLGEQETVTLSGFTDPDWNKSFILRDVPNRKQFVVQSANTVPTLNSNEELNEVLITGVNGIFEITKISNTQFSFNTSSRDTNTTATIKSNPRVTAVPDVDEMARQYTEQKIDSFWAFVVLGAVSASKDRSIKSDRLNSRTAADDKRSNYSQPFSIYVLAPAQDQYSALRSMDRCYQELLFPFTKSLVGFKPTSPLTEQSVFVVTFAGSSNAGYNRATYIHQYDFEFAFDLVNEDSVEPLSNQAFREIPSSFLVGNDEPLTGDLNLDEDPLS